MNEQERKDKVMAEVQPMLDRLTELHAQGDLDAFTIIVGLQPTDTTTDRQTDAGPQGKADLAYGGCCYQHMYDFLAPDICMTSPQEGLRELAHREMDRMMREVWEGVQAASLEYGEFREFIVPPSQN